MVPDPYNDFSIFHKKNEYEKNKYLPLIRMHKLVGGRQFVYECPNSLTTQKKLMFLNVLLPRK